MSTRENIRLIARAPLGAQNDCHMETVLFSTNIRFSANLAVQMRKLTKIKPSQNGEITLSLTDVGKSCLVAIY